VEWGETESTSAWYVGHWWVWSIWWGNRSTQRKPAPVLLCPQQIPHDLTWDRTRAAAVGDRRLTTWAMAQPCFYLINCREDFTRYCHVYGWLIRRGFGLDDWIYCRLFVQSLVITMNYNNSSQIFSQTLLPWLPRTRSILTGLSLFWTTGSKSKSKSHCDGRSVSQ
jgi:hypothetical protein